MSRLARVTLPVWLVAATAAATPVPGDVVRVEHHAVDALPTLGPVTAPVTIELFFAPVQRQRRRDIALVESLQAKHPSRIRVIYRIVKATGSSRLHYAALEAYAEGTFKQFLDALDASRTNLTDAALLELGKSIGMDPQQLAIAIANPPPGYDRVLDANERRRKKKVRGGGVPLILINGKTPHSAGSLAELELEYAAALEAAEDLLDRGAEPRALPDAYEQLTAPNPLELAIPVGNTDETVDDLPDLPPIATPALDLRGMPSLGPATAQVTIAILCSPASLNCAAALRAARAAQDVYSEAVRIVWAPFFDVAREDAADLGFLADAALCAERVGTSSDDLDAPGSQGWRWVESMSAESNLGRRNRKLAPELLLEKVSDKLHVDKQAFAACRASQAGGAIQWIEKARHAGVRASPSTVVGGRVYPSITDATTLQQLVGAELEPGDCPGCLRLGDYAPTWRKR
jgi:protein-disulfide isomerase